MTALDRLLAKTFRAARWESTGGVAGCPDCFDGDDLEQPTPDPMTPGLARYRCKLCYTRFSDVKGTVLETRKPVPLALWAYLVLHGNPRLLGMTEPQVQRCFDLAAKIKGRALAAGWRATMHAAGLTADRVRTHLVKTGGHAV